MCGPRRRAWAEVLERSKGCSSRFFRSERGATEGCRGAGAIPREGGDNCSETMTFGSF